MAIENEDGSLKYERLLLKYEGNPDGPKLDFYESHGGYEGARKALAMPAGDVVKLVKDSGLRGRGGAGFSTGMKWSFCPPPDGMPRYLAVNADESEPGTFKDRVIIDWDPHAIIEGSIIAAWGAQLTHGYVYIRGEFTQGAKILQKAIDEAYKKGYLGKGIFGTKFDFEFTLHRGAGAYICGEETGMLTSIEGGMGYPKIKPPFPAVQGLFKRPTVVNNVETLANLPHIVTKGVAWHKSFGTEKSPGIKLFSVCGHVKRPGNYEVPLGIPLKELIYDLAGGIRDDRKLKAVIPGGSSAPVLTAEEAEKVTMDYEGLAGAGTMLGSGGVIVLDETVCMVDALLNLAKFYHHESCGQCTPCREGCGWTEKILDRIEDGHGRTEDLDMLLEIASNMRGKTICVLADALALPIQSFVPKFRDEFQFHITNKDCYAKAMTRAAAATT